MKIKPMLGSFALEGIEYLESDESRALAEHHVPGLAGNYFQDLGSVANSIVIAGTRYGDDARDAFLTGIRELFNAGTPTTFVADINTATDIVDVIVEQLHVAEVAGGPDAFRYTVALRKFVKPPEPPATDLVDAGILDDALSVLDALDALDALASIPSIADPTPPLLAALDGLKTATQGIDAVVADITNVLGT